MITIIIGMVIGIIIGIEIVRQSYFKLFLEYLLGVVIGGVAGGTLGLVVQRKNIEAVRECYVLPLGFSCRPIELRQLLLLSMQC